MQLGHSCTFFPTMTSYHVEKVKFNSIWMEVLLMCFLLIRQQWNKEIEILRGIRNLETKI